MHVKVFKFGGASVNNAAGVKNVADIIRRFDRTPLLVVISAMGKTTNALEEVLAHYIGKDPVAVVESFRKVRDYHFSIMDELFEDKNHLVFGEVDSLFNQLRGHIRRGHLFSQVSLDFDFEYDQIVSYGELISSAILHHYLALQGCRSTLFDVRGLIITDSTFRDARVDWSKTKELVLSEVQGHFSVRKGMRSVAVTQGFIAGDASGNTTTLGREGSDFSAAVFAWCLQSKEMTIWKDVPGVMNADPKWMPGSRCLKTLSYREAIELAYYGASVIHPKTIKPLENAGIILKVRSFSDPDLPGTSVRSLRKWKIPFPIFIRKQNQMLISVSPRDFSFILEENLSGIFRILADFRVKVNMMHNSAISFSFCVDAEQRKVAPLLAFLNRDYETRYNEGLELITIRHYDEEAVTQMTRGRKVMMEVRSRNTVQFVTPPLAPPPHGGGARGGGHGITTGKSYLNSSNAGIPRMFDRKS